MAYEAEVKREEINDGQRTLVIELKDVVDGEVKEYTTERTKIPLNATNKQVESMLQTMVDDRGVSKELRDRIEEVRQAGADPVGLSASEESDRKAFVDRMIQRSKNGQEARWDKVHEEVKEKKELAQKHGMDPEKNTYEDLVRRDAEVVHKQLKQQKDLSSPLSGKATEVRSNEDFSSMSLGEVKMKREFMKQELSQ